MTDRERKTFEKYLRAIPVQLNRLALADKGNPVDYLTLAPCSKLILDNLEAVKAFYEANKDKAGKKG